MDGGKWSKQILFGTKRVLHVLQHTKHTSPHPLQFRELLSSKIFYFSFVKNYFRLIAKT